MLNRQDFQSQKHKQGQCTLWGQIFTTSLQNYRDWRALICMYILMVLNTFNEEKWPCKNQAICTQENLKFVTCKLKVTIFPDHEVISNLFFECWEIRLCYDQFVYRIGWHAKHNKNMDQVTFEISVVGLQTIIWRSFWSRGTKLVFWETFPTSDRIESKCGGKNR